ncbi:MAG: DUF4255 domain-containing protein [Cytophagales bacterium]|nr:DUF4255 domain-containing protein [Cytophagales bacterium]
MLAKAISVVAGELNAYLKFHRQFLENRVILSPIVEQDGRLAIREENRIVFTLTDLSEESSLKNHRSGRKAGAENNPPDLHLNAQILVSAYFSSSNYSEALDYLSDTISFFHSKPVFNTRNTPALQIRGIDKLSMELIRLDTNTKNNLWSSMGVKYLPSAMYKMKIVRFQSQKVGDKLPQLSDVPTEIHKE